MIQIKINSGEAYNKDIHMPDDLYECTMDELNRSLRNERLRAAYSEWKKGIISDFDVLKIYQEEAEKEKLEFLKLLE